MSSEPTGFHRQEVFTGSSGLKVFANPDVLPRAFAVHEAYRIEDRREAPRQLDAIAAELDRKTFLLTEPPALEQCGGRDTVSVRTHRPGRVLLTASMACRGMLILTDTYFPGWTATVDGRPAPIHEAYAVVRGVVVEGGTHTLEFRYRPRSVLAGAALSALAALAALGFALLPKRSPSQPVVALPSGASARAIKPTAP